MLKVLSAPPLRRNPLRTPIGPASSQGFLLLYPPEAGPLPLMLGAICRAKWYTPDAKIPPATRSGGGNDFSGGMR